MTAISMATGCRWREDPARAPTLHLDDADRPTDHSYAERLYDDYNARRYWDV